MDDILSSDECSERLKAIADPDRLRIIQVLRLQPWCVSEIAELLEKEIGSVSHHLQILKNRGIVETEKQGKQVIYSLAPGVFSKGRSKNDALDFGCCRIELPKSPPASH